MTKLQKSRPYRVESSEANGYWPSQHRRVVSTHGSEAAAWRRVDALLASRPDLILSVYCRGQLVRRADRLYSGAVA